MLTPGSQSSPLGAKLHPQGPTLGAKTGLDIKPPVPWNVQYSGGFATDVSESCIWLTPFIKKPGDMVDLW
jgi:hypothetical protein